MIGNRWGIAMPGCPTKPLGYFDNTEIIMKQINSENMEETS